MDGRKDNNIEVSVNKLGVEIDKLELLKQISLEITEKYDTPVRIEINVNRESTKANINIILFGL